MGPVVVLDMDGVILRTGMVKMRAMLALFAGLPQHQRAIESYIRANTGVPRAQKIVTILRDIVGVTVDAAEVDRYRQRYTEALAAELAHAAMVDGVETFVRTTALPLYVSSSAPDGEVLLQLQRRNLDGCFVRLFGESTPKPGALRAIMAAHPGRAVVFFGDSVSDLEAARAAGTGFVAVVAEADHFGAGVACKLASFRDAEAVRHCMEVAVSRIPNARGGAPASPCA